MAEDLKSILLSLVALSSTDPYEALRKLAEIEKVRRPLEDKFRHSYSSETDDKIYEARRNAIGHVFSKYGHIYNPPDLKPSPQISRGPIPRYMPWVSFGSAVSFARAWYKNALEKFQSANFAGALAQASDSSGTFGDAIKKIPNSWPDSTAMLSQLKRERVAALRLAALAAEQTHDYARASEYRRQVGDLLREC